MKSQGPAMRPSSLRKREAILSAAESAFLTSRYEEVTMDDIAETAGVSKQTLYAHFGTKGQLFVALVTAMTRATADGVTARATGAVQPGKDIEENLVDVLELQLAAVLDPRILQLRRLVIGEVSRFPDLARAVYDHGPRHAIDHLTDTLREASRLGLLEVPDPRQAAGQLNWLVMGDPVNRAMFLGDDAVPTPRERRTHVRAAVRAFLRANGCAPTH